jgi:hypothetical protein
MSLCAAQSRDGGGEGVDARPEGLEGVADLPELLLGVAHEMAVPRGTLCGRNVNRRLGMSPAVNWRLGERVQER